MGQEKRRNYSRDYRGTEDAKNILNEMREEGEVSKREKPIA
jgi:hypothetical protein